MGMIINQFCIISSNTSDIMINVYSFWALSNTITHRWHLEHINILKHPLKKSIMYNPIHLKNYLLISIRKHQYSKSLQDHLAIHSYLEKKIIITWGSNFKRTIPIHWITSKSIKISSNHILYDGNFIFFEDQPKSMPMFTN